MSDDLPDEIMVWRSNPKLHHLGTWATTRYPAEAVAYVPAATITQLRADLNTANERAEKAERERDAIHEQVRDMLADQECACGYDKPTDVCLGHLPFHRKTVARAEAAEADAAALRARVERIARKAATLAVNEMGYRWGDLTKATRAKIAALAPAAPEKPDA